LRRTTAVGLGIALCVPAVWLWWNDYRWEKWYTDGLGLVVGATGLALILAGVGGRRPDWIERSQSPKPKAQSPVPKALSPKPKAQSPKPKA
jgi:hypothetical protein